MAISTDQLKAARNAGYSDDEISAHLSDPSISKARTAGYSLDEVAGHFDTQAHLAAVLPQVEQRIATTNGTRELPQAGLQGVSALTGEPIPKGATTDTGVGTTTEMNVEKAGETPLVRLPRPTGDSLAADVGKGLSDLVSSMTTAKNAGMVISAPAIAAMAPIAATAVGAGFLGYTAEQLPKQILDASLIQDPHERRAALTGVVANSIAAVLPAFHLAKPEVIDGIASKVDELQSSGNPETASALAQTEVSKIVEENKPQILSTAMKQGDTIKTGAQPFDSHADIIQQAAKEGVDITEGEHGFIVPDGTGGTKFASRTEAASIARDYSQITPEQHEAAMVRPEEPGLHSEDLQANQKEGEPTNEKEANADAQKEGQITTPEEKGDVVPPADPLSQPEGITDGVYPAERLAAESHTQELAHEMSPKALGIIHPLPGFLQNIADWFSNRPTTAQIGNRLKGEYQTAMGATMPKTTIADQASGEAGARLLASKISAPYLARTFSSSVLEGTGVDPVKFGAALTEDNLRSVKQGFIDQAKEATAKGEPDASAEAKAKADAVTTTVGGKGTPFANEADYQAFLKEPATGQAIEKHRALWQQVIDPMYKNAQSIDPTEVLPGRGQATGARVNLYADDGTVKGPKVSTASPTNNLLNTLRKKSPFGTQAKGTGTAYNVDYHQMMENTFARQFEIANKNAFENKLVDAGHAVIDKPGEKIMMPDGEETTAFPLKRQRVVTQDGKSFSQNQSIYIRKSLAGEYARANNLDRIPIPAAWKATANILNQSALAGLTDASVHVLNLGTALFTRPSVAGSLISDSLLSTFGRADVPVAIVKSIAKGFKDNQTQLGQLAEIGAMREGHTTANPLGKLIQWADKTTRLVLDDSFKKMADAGLVENTETNRREFVNQVGQYNKRAQSDLMRLARDTGIAPFATAGKTFNALGVRMMMADPGVKATSGMAATALRANVLSKWVGATALVGGLNYMLTKDKGGGVMGRPGVPIGNIDTGQTDHNGRPLSIPVFAALGLTRAMRVTGVRGVLEAKRRGLTSGDAMDQAGRDIVNSAISPFAGPIVRFASEAATGYQPAINVGRATAVAPPGKSQIKENVKQAALDANPIVRSVMLANQPGGSVADAVRQQIPRLSMQPSNPGEMMARYPEIVRKAQAAAYIDDTVGRARKMEMGPVRNQFIRSQLSKLDPEDQKQAIQTLRYRRITWAGHPANTPKLRSAARKAK